MRKVLLALLLASVGMAPLSSAADRWPQFRGAGNSLAEESQIPAEWGPEKNLAWKIKLPGTGWSSPIVWGDKVFVTSAATENQRPPRPFGGFGGPGGPGGQGGRGGPPDRASDRDRSDEPAIEPQERGQQQGEEQERQGAAQQGQRGQGERRPGGFQPGGIGRGGFGRGQQPPDDVYRWEVHCLDLATGKTLWKQLALEAKPRIPTHSTNTYASETPVTDGERLYVYFGMTGLFCYDLAGNPLWKKDLGSYPMLMGWGTGSSPVLDEDRLFLQCDNEEKSFLVAFDKRTGEELWRMPREERSSWATPYVWRNKKRTELVTIGSQKARSYDPATGKLLWELAMAGRNSASPVADDEMLYLGSGGGGGMFGGGGFGGGGAGGGFGRQPDRGQPDRGQSGGAQQERDREPQERSAQEANTQQERAQERGGQQGQQGGAQPGQRGRGGFGGGGFGGGGGSGALVAVKAGASGDISLKSNETSNEYVAWQRMRAGPAMASPLLYRGYLYVLEQRGGIVSCYDAKTGEPAYAQKRLQGARGFTSSPWASDGKIFCLDDNAQTFVLAAGPEFNLLGTNSLDEMCWSSPAIASGRLLLRTAENLYCFKQP